MGTKDVARPYALALAATARDGGDVEAFLEPLEAFVRVASAEPAAAVVFCSPYLSRGRRAQLAGDIARALNTPPPLANFLSLVARRRRGGALRAMAEAYRGICDAERGRVKGRVISAVKVPEEMRRRLERSIARLVKRAPELRFEEDPALVGGFVVFVENRMYDLSVRGALARLAGEEQ